MQMHAYNATPTAPTCTALSVQRNAVGFGPDSGKSSVVEVGLPLRVGAPSITAGQVGGFNALFAWAGQRRQLSRLQEGSWRQLVRRRQQAAATL